MKVNLPRSVTGKGPFHGHEIRLTIAMIVKNEEKTLDRCLSSLQPLLEAVPSELIITDTGSTDETVEIARKYTDRILHFEWCDDFAAARNTGMKEARGEWFMFLDGDEWFENTDDLIEFFSSGECDQYGSASYIQRNYTNDSGKDYNDFNVLRLCRMHPQIHFEHSIHEDFGRLEPVRFLKDYVNHYGYVFHSDKEQQEKFGRNRTLLEREIELHPDAMKMYHQLTKQLVGDDIPAAEKYCLLGLDAEKKHPARQWRLVLQQTLAYVYYTEKEYRKLLDLVDPIIEEDRNPESCWMDFYCFTQSAAFIRREYERSAKYGEAYLEIYRKYKSGEVNREFDLVSAPSCAKTKNREQVLLLLMQTNLLLSRSERAVELLDEVDFSDWEQMRPFLRIGVQACSQSSDVERLPALYQKFSGAAGEDHRMEMLRVLDASLPTDTESRAAVVDALAGIPEEDSYIRLCRLRDSEEKRNREAAAGEREWFLRWDGPWDPIYSDVLFYAMKDKADLMSLVSKIDTEDLKYYVAEMKKDHGTFELVICGYMESFSPEDLRGLYWSVCLREKVLLSENDAFISENDRVAFFEKYAAQIARYVRLLYRPELFSEEQIPVLPRAHRFGWYMGEALSAGKMGDGVAYLKNLRLALAAYPVMEKLIQLLLDRFQKNEEQKEAKAQEFRALAEKVKAQISELIGAGRMEEAGQITSRLAALMPNDPDVVRFRKLTHTEPTMREIASRLPQ